MLTQCNAYVRVLVYIYINIYMLNGSYSNRSHTVESDGKWEMVVILVIVVVNEQVGQ